MKSFSILVFVALFFGAVNSDTALSQDQTVAVQSEPAGEINMETPKSPGAASAKEAPEPVPSSGAVTPQEVKEKTEEAFETAREYMRLRLEEYERKLKVKLDDLNREMEQLQKDAEKETPRAKEKVDEQLQQMEKHKHELQKRLDILRSKSRDALKEMQKHLDSAFHEFENFVKDNLPRSEDK